MIGFLGKLYRCDAAYSVCGEGHMAILEQFVTQKVGKSMILLIEGEDGRVGSTCN